MITFLEEPDCKISQETYRASLSKLPLKQMRCSCCGSVGQLTRHAYYKREVKSDGWQIPLTIERLKCSKCNHTHAIVPSYIVPYCQVTVWDQVEILRQYMEGLGISMVLKRNPSIDESLAYAIIQKYRKYWKRCFPSENVLFVPVGEVSSFCFSNFNKQFMQVRDTPNDFFS